MTQEKQSVAEIVAAVFIENLKAGVVPWRRPWFFDKSNFQSKRPYSGINRWTLWGDDSYFLTKRQIEALGGKIKKSEEKNGKPVVFYLPDRSQLRIEVKGRKPVLVEEQTPAFARYFTVWGMSQIRGIKYANPQPLELDANFKLDTLSEACRLPILKGGNEAFCTPKEIHVPRERQFHSSAGYYSVLFHEIGHSLQDQKKQLEYEVEELVAELFSSMCLNYCGIRDMDEIIDQSTAYCAHYIKLLEEKPRIMLKAASLAEKRFWVLLERFANQKGELLAA